MAGQKESGFCFLRVTYEGGHNFLDLYLPAMALAQVQLTPGAAVLLGGLGSKPVTSLQLRPSKGTESFANTNAFSASISLPNSPGGLLAFLGHCERAGIHFTSIRTGSALLAGTRTEIAIEGTANNVPRQFVVSDQIKSFLQGFVGEIDGEVLWASILDFKNFFHGSVTSSAYESSLPVFRGSYRKARFDFLGEPRPFNRPLKHLEGALHIVRYFCDQRTLTIELDLSFADFAVYLLRFVSRDLTPGSPVTRTILEALPEAVNVEVLDAFEYQEWDPTLIQGRLGRGRPDSVSRRVGIIEMLFSSNVQLQAQELQARLGNALSQQEWPTDEAPIEVRDAYEALTNDETSILPEDTGTAAFRKSLKDGRYLYVAHEGDGAFGNVNRYFDTEKSEMVAAKHVLDPNELREDEINALIRAAERSKSRHLVAYQDFFFDGLYPVIVMDLVENVLERWQWNREWKGGRQHPIPRTISSVVDMAIQLSQGLIDLLTGEDYAEIQFLHSDVKPANIGFIMIGDEVIWKLLDFGLAKRLPRNVTAEPTVSHGGTPAYISPQVRLGLKDARNDIYSLGVVLFRVLNDWRHPSPTYLRSQFGASEYPPEVVRYLRWEENGREGPEPDGYAEKEWKLGKPFDSQGLPARAEEELKRLVFRIIDLSSERRFQAPADVKHAFEGWRDKYLIPRRNSP
ncbi:MAG: protein kinase [Chloroflexi bacterium]|nr:protein kinase [Chloroflexota bacterium]